ncbi:hypothetical protein EV182_008010, partial [Spiromyces aspiralis]
RTFSTLKGDGEGEVRTGTALYLEPSVDGLETAGAVAAAGGGSHGIVSPILQTDGYGVDPAGQGAQLVPSYLLYEEKQRLARVERELRKLKRI